jgi:hypothetical protein
VNAEHDLRSIRIPIITDEMSRYPVQIQGAFDEGFYFLVTGGQLTQ